MENYALGSEINHCIGRIFSFYSTLQSNDFLYPSLRKKLRESSNNKTINILNAKNVLDIQRADNVVKIIIKLFDKRAKGIYNIGTGKGIEIESFVKNLTKKKIKIITNTKNKRIVIANIKKLNSVIL